MCEEVCDEPNIFDDGKVVMINIFGPPEIKELIRVPSELLALEDRVKLWAKRVQEVGTF